MTIQYYVPMKAHAEVQTHLFSKTGQFKELLKPRRIFVTVLLLLVWGIANLYFRNLVVFILSTLILLTLVVVYQKFLPKIVYSNIRRDLLASIKGQLKGQEYDGNVRFSLEENGITLESGDLVLDKNYEELAHITEEIDFLMIYHEDQKNAYAIPLAHFKTPQELDDFIDALTEKISAAKQAALLIKEEA